MVQRGVVGKNEILVHRQGESVPDFGHDFRLFDRVNAQFTLKVLVHLNEISRIAGVVHHYGNKHAFNIGMSATCGWCCGRGNSG